jgi:hypothetical protein
MKITIEFDPGELARGAPPTVTAAGGHAGANTLMMAPAAYAATVGAIDAGPSAGAAATDAPMAEIPTGLAAHAAIGAVDAGPAPGATATDPAMAEIPAELATQAAAIGAISAGPAPNLG